MTDIVSKKKRSEMMSGIKGKNTKPEMMIRSHLHAMGYRFKLHDKTLPGKPDLVFPKYKAVIFVHGCFWHAHDCSLFKVPSSNKQFWTDKLQGNKDRDNKDILELKNLGWKVLIIWECSIRGRSRLSIDQIAKKFSLWLAKDKQHIEIRCL